jgi:hypothetical protein
MTTTTEQIAGLTFGTELETVGLSRPDCAAVIVTVVGGVANYTGGTYDTTEVTQPDGRVWKCMRDGSLTYGLPSCEVVTPICTMADMDTLQKVVRALRSAGARVDASCSQHVHVGVKTAAGVAMTSRQIASVARSAHKLEPIFTRALGVQAARLGQFCRPTDASTIAAISGAASTMGTLEAAWYRSNGSGPAYSAKRNHYDPSRYHGINLHSVFFRGTIEFRWFEGTMHAGEVRANVTLALAVVAYGMAANRKSRTSTWNSAWNTKQTMRYLLTHDLGMTAREYRHVVDHLTKRLPEAPAAPAATLTGTL